MKTIAVIANNKEFAEYIKENVDRYFAGLARTKAYSTAELEGLRKIREDVAMLSSYTIFPKVRAKISEDSVLVNYSQTLSTKNAAILRDAYEEEPFDAAYLVNIDYRFCTSVIMELYEAGLSFIELVPYFGDESTLTDKIKIAVHPGEEKLVPPGMERVIDIGQRVLDAECVVELAEKLGLNSAEVLSRESAEAALEEIADKRRRARPIARSGEKGRRVYGSSEDTRFRFGSILGKSAVMKEKVDIAKRIALSDASVLITGESGTGKEVFAQSIHNGSSRKDYRFVAINCAAIPESLFESELFGYEEGAFSGAKKSGKAGYFELANKGTLFLDEVGEMPLLLQGKLLRAIEERRVARVGSSHLTDVDVRIIAATNRELEELVREKKFRSDLYFRLNVLPLRIPALRERKEDVLELFASFRAAMGGKWTLSKDARDFLEEYSWPGNIRELRNVVQYLDSLGLDMIRRSDLPPLIGESVYGAGKEASEGKEKASEAKKEASEEKAIWRPAVSASFHRGGSGSLGGEFTDFMLLEGRDLALHRAVLSALSEAKISGRNMGRQAVLEYILEGGAGVTEAEVRMSLRKLSEQGFIRSGRGRGGSKLLPKGERLLEEISSIIGE